MNEVNENVDLGPFTVSCEIANEINEVINELPLDLYKEVFSKPVDMIVDEMKELSEKIETECSPEEPEAGAEVSPSPTPSDASKTESLEIDR